MVGFIYWKRSRFINLETFKRACALYTTISIQFTHMTHLEAKGGKKKTVASIQRYGMSQAKATEIRVHQLRTA